MAKTVFEDIATMVNQVGSSLKIKHVPSGYVVQVDTGQISVQVGPTSTIRKAIKEALETVH